MKFVIKVLIIALLSLILPLPSFAASNREIEFLLKWFEEDTEAFMLRSEVRPESNGILIPPEQLFAKNEVRDRLLEAARLQREDAGVTAPPDNERIEDLIDVKDLTGTNGKIIRSLNEMESLGFRSANVADDVWSGPAWAQYRGHTAQRYNIKEAREAKSWQDAWAFVSAPGNTFYDVITGRSATTRFDDLSPAEKYDLLIGTAAEIPQGALSKYEWLQGRERFERIGQVPTWHGYCHGWALAAYMTPRPTNYVDAVAADGKTVIRFYPSDIKALQTVLWGNAMPYLRIVGNRCNVADPKRDENGRIIDSPCFDTNPGLFHMGIVNQLANAKRNLIIDATYDLQIWNQPVKSFSYKYFNPQTKKAGSTLEQSTVAIEKFTKDKFRKYRSPDAKAVVGIAMDIVYARGTTPSHKTPDSTKQDKSKKITYLYDVEIDAKGEIIGGEWYQVRHPDFLWNPQRGSKAISRDEKAVKGDWGTWNLTQPVPLVWRPTALKAAASGAPLAHIVDRLNRVARGESD